MRVAVCLSGEPRTWKTSVNNIKQFFGDVDYFIHTWRGNSWRIGSDWNYQTLKSEDVEEIGDIYNAKAFIHQPPKFITNTIYGSLFESMRKSFILKRDYELENGFEYDIVVKARLDMIYDPAERFFVHEPAVLSAYAPEYPYRMPREFNAANFNEVLFYGNSPTMDLIGDAYLSVIKECTWDHYNANSDKMIETIHMKYGPGAYLNHYMARHSISAFPAPRIFQWTVVRQEAEDRNLDSIDDYSTIRKIHEDFY